MTTEIRCSLVPWFDRLQIAVFNKDWNGVVSIAAPLTLVPFKQGKLVGEPTLSVRVDEAQQFMDELWRCGLRPSEGAGSAGSLKATETHLADMRRIAFELLAMDTGKEAA